MMRFEWKCEPSGLVTEGNRIEIRLTKFGISITEHVTEWEAECTRRFVKNMEFWIAAEG